MISFHPIFFIRTGINLDKHTTDAGQTSLMPQRPYRHSSEARREIDLLLLPLKSVELDDDVALLLSVAGLVMGPHGTSESEIGGTDSAALRTSWTCLRLCGSCVTSCTSFFRGSDPADK